MTRSRTRSQAEGPFEGEASGMAVDSECENDDDEDDDDDDDGFDRGFLQCFEGHLNNRCSSNVRERGRVQLAYTWLTSPSSGLPDGTAQPLPGVGQRRRKPICLGPPLWAPAQHVRRSQGGQLRAGDAH